MSTSSTAPRVAVIGGGIAGVSAAWRLRRLLGADAKILLIEAYGRLGGKLKTVNFETGPVDMGAEAYLGVNQRFTDLVREVGLEGELQRTSGARSSFFIDGRFVDIPKETLMGIPASSAAVRDVIGEAADRIDAEKDGQPMTWSAQQDTTVGQLVAARFGQPVVDKLVSPLLGGVYSCTADDLGVRSTMPQLAAKLDQKGKEGAEFYLVDVIQELLDERVARATAARESGATQGPGFLTLRGGFRSLVEAMIKEAQPDQVMNSPVEFIGLRQDGRYYLEPIGNVDAVVVATPAPTAAVLLEDVAPVAAEHLSQVELSGSAVVGMRFASDHGIPDQSGVLLSAAAPTDAKAFTFSSRKWPHIAERGGAMVRASYGTYQEPWYLESTDRALLSYAMDDLYRITGEQKRPEEFFVQRWYGGIPRYGVGHLESMGQVVADVAQRPRLGIAGSMLNGVGVPATAATGLVAAEKIVADLA